MTPGNATAWDVRDLHRHDILSAQRDEPANRTDETKFFAPPMHTAPERQPRHKLRENARQNLFRRFPDIDDIRPDVFAVFHQSVRRNAEPARKTFRRPRRFPVRIKSDGNGRPAFFERFIRLPLRRARDQDGQAPRRPVYFHIFIRKTRRRKLLLRERRQLRNRRRHDIGGHFLRPDFQKQIPTHFAASFNMGKPSSSRFSKYAFAQRRARLRTRPMYSVRSAKEIAPAASSKLNVCEHFST